MISHVFLRAWDFLFYKDLPNLGLQEDGQSGIFIPGMANKAFVYIWEYIVREEYLIEFEKAYGPQGDWVQLFEKAEGYIGTDLHRDVSNSRRFITIDHWKTIEDRDNFRKKYSREFEQLDERCERFTESEKWLGDFDSIAKPS